MPLCITVQLALERGVWTMLPASAHLGMNKLFGSERMSTWRSGKRWPFGLVSDGEKNSPARSRQRGELSRHEIESLHFGGDDARTKARLPSRSASERRLLRPMVAAGEREIAEVYVVAGSDMPVTPCGGCRQKLAGRCWREPSS